MTLTQLEYALAVEQHLNFQRAADACFVSQPSLSAQIKKLEETLGITLFQRSTNSGVVVTDAGQAALNQARSILADAQRLKDLCSQFNNETSGTLKLGIIPTVSPYLIPLFLNSLKKNHPDLHIELTEDSTKNLMTELSFGRIDAAILSPPNKAPAHLIEKLLYYESFVVYGHKKHPLFLQSEIKLSTLSDYAVTLLDETHCMRDQVVSACSSLQLDVSPITLKQGSLQTLIALVESQNSFTLIPKLAEDVLQLKYRKEALRTIVAPTPYRKVSLIYNKNLVRKKLVDALHTVIQKSLPDSVSTKMTAKGMVIEPSKQYFKVN